MLSLVLLLLLEDNVVSPRQFLPLLLVAGGVEEEDAAAQDTVEDSEGAVECHVLLVLGEGADDEADEDQGHDDQVGPLHDLGAHQLGLVNPRQSEGREKRFFFIQWRIVLTIEYIILQLLMT